MDKWLIYEAFKPYYHREAIHITSPSDKDAFITFAKNTRQSSQRYPIPRKEEVFLDLTTQMI